MSGDTTDDDADPGDGSPDGGSQRDGAPPGEDPPAADQPPDDGPSPDDERPPSGGPGTCDFCRHDLVLEPATLEREGQTHEFCSSACRERFRSDEYVFSGAHDGRRVRTGVAGIDRHLPEGMPRNSFVLLAGTSGTRTDAIFAELLWRTLERGEPAVAVTLTEPPGSFVQNFLSLEWNVLPYLERGDLRLIDAFTYRVDDRGRLYDRMNRWNRHIHDIAEDVTETVRDASDMTELQNTIDRCLEERDVTDEGAVVIDSLTELGTLVQPVQAYDFVKDLRADVCKGRFVPVFAGATYTSDEVVFPHDLGYVMDGVVQLDQSGDLVQDTLIKRARIRKMSGVLSIAEWTAYEYTGGIGMVTFDPREEIERSREAAADGTEGQPDEGCAGGGQDSAADAAPDVAGEPVETTDTGPAGGAADASDPGDTHDAADTDDQADG